MVTTSDTPKHKLPFVAGFWLIPAIPVFAFLVLPFMIMLGLDDLYTVPGLIVMFLVHFGAGYLWARSLGFRSGLPDNKLMNISGGIGFALGVVGILGILTELDTKLIDPWLGNFHGIGNLEFGALFAPWTGLVAGISGLALGLSLRKWKLGLRMFGIGFVSGFLIYLAIMVTMQLFGFEVGSGRPVMLPTTFLSMWTTALVGSALFGKALTDSNEQ